MNARRFLLIVTALAGAGVLAGLGVLSFGSSDQAARVPASGMLVAAVVALIGTIWLMTSRPPASACQKPQSLLSTIGFAILVVIAAFLISFVVTNH